MDKDTYVYEGSCVSMEFEFDGRNKGYYMGKKETKVSLAGLSPYRTRDHHV